MYDPREHPGEEWGVGRERGLHLHHLQPHQIRPHQRVRPRGILSEMYTFSAVVDSARVSSDIFSE